jgi:phage-related protein|nr:MAG TPA_asm: tail tape measure protein [Caudoviricetes sp.]
MNLLDLFVKIAVDNSDVDKGFSETSSKAESLAGKLKGGLAAAAKVGAAALTAAATGMAALTKASIDQYAEYEQLVGGVDTLFKTASDKVQEYAANAYKTAGMSANEYMDTVTSFSASLLQSLGGDTDKAAQKADQAITDMADNANKMGTGMEMIQNAYQGFAKQNYTMLDNLKLGYGGTKEEMERLLADAEKLSGQKFDISSYSDIVDAIHVVQTEMGITGTTAAEAASTIEGSAGSAKAAWSNLITGIADENADFKTLTSNFVDSLVAAGKNIIPRISVILGGISQLVTSASTTIIPMVITTITDNLPALLQAAVALVGALGQGIIDSLPAITQAAIGILFFLANGLIENLPTLIDGIVQVTLTIVQMLTSPDFLTQLIETAILLIMTLAQGLIDAIPQLIAAVPMIIGNLLAAIIVELPNIIQMGIDLLFALIDGIIKCIPELVAAVPTLIIAFTNGIVNNLDKIILAAPQIIVSLITGIIGAIPELIAAVPRVIAAIADTIKNYDWGGIGRNIVQGLKDGIAGMWDNIKDWFNEKVNSLVGGVKRILGIHSPSKVFAGIGGFMAEGLGEGFSDEFASVKNDIEGSMNFDAGTITADANISRNYTSGSYGAASTSGGGDSGRIVMLLEQYLPMLANMKVIMDSGQVIGLLAPGMDEELAKINARKARAV